MLNIITRKLLISLGLTLVLAGQLCGCGVEDTTADNESELASDSLTEETRPSETKEDAVVVSAADEAYKAALVSLLSEQTLPEGQEAVFYEGSFMDDNSFAIYDYDDDSEDELVLCWDATLDGAMFEAVYKYDEETDSLRQIYYESLNSPADWSDIDSRNGLLGNNRYDEYYALTDTNIDIFFQLRSGMLSQEEVFDFSTPRNNRYISYYHSDWPQYDASTKTKDARQGIDVSSYQGDIDFAKVKEAGYEFVIVRIAFRGYGTTGSLNVDKRSISNIKNAKAAGLDVGVYIFSQAINEEEAIEEADFCFEILEEAGITQGSQLDLPLVFDPESILYEDSRTDDVTGEQFTKNCIAFCQAVEERGFEPMIYANTTWEAYECLGYIWYYGRTGERDYKKVSKCRNLFDPVPEVYTRLARIRKEQGKEEEAANLYLVAKDFLAQRIRYNAFFGNLNIMKWLIDDLYDFEVIE